MASAVCSISRQRPQAAPDDRDADDGEDDQDAAADEQLDQRRAGRRSASTSARSTATTKRAAACDAHRQRPATAPSPSTAGAGVRRRARRGPRAPAWARASTLAVAARPPTILPGAVAAARTRRRSAAACRQARGPLLPALAQPSVHRRLSRSSWLVDAVEQVAVQHRDADHADDSAAPSATSASIGRDQLDPQRRRPALEPAPLRGSGGQAQDVADAAQGVDQPGLGVSTLRRSTETYDSTMPASPRKS